MKQVLLCIVLFMSANASALEVNKGDYRNRADVLEFIQRMAKQSDYSEQDLVTLFSTVEKQAHLFERLNKPAEKALQWHEYRRIFLKQARIQKGVQFWRQDQKLLSEVSKKTGVPEEIIVAIIGVESFYGTYRGKDPVFDSLVTLAFDYPARAPFFIRELEQFLLLSKEQQFDPKALKGSYAGAMGMPQFIASSYRNYAVDFDGDGKINLFDDKGDIFASIANYFVRHGWVSGQPVAQLLTLAPVNRVGELEPGVRTIYTWTDLTQRGLVAQQDIGGQTAVALVKLEQKDNAEYWAGLQNFYVITRYNHSEMYAMAVYQLAQLIKDGFEQGE